MSQTSHFKFIVLDAISVVSSKTVYHISAKGLKVPYTIVSSLIYLVGYMNLYKPIIPVSSSNLFIFYF